MDVVPGGDYIISRATFPAYFLQGDPEQARCDLELTLFGKRIAPALGITRRFVGQEPYSPVTARYNQRMQALLPQWGIRVEEIPRLEGISASRVRQLLRQGRLAELQPWCRRRPMHTVEITLEQVLLARDRRVQRQKL